MKSSKFKLNPCFPLLIFGLTALVCGQASRSADTFNKVDLESLRLPSFSIFALPLSDDPSESGDLVEQSRLEAFLHKVNAERTKGAIKEGDYLWIVPMVFYKSRALFSKGSWTGEEVKQGHLISGFLARLSNKPNLIITGSDRDSFAKGLAKLRDWFVSLCRDNRTLASMIFTLDAGPFFGEEIALDRFPEMKIVGFVAIPQQDARLAVMTDETQPDLTVIGVINSDTSVKWLKTIVSTPQARIAGAALAGREMERLEGYGFVLRLISNWPSRTNHYRLYLDESLGLRFYYLSW